MLLPIILALQIVLVALQVSIILQRQRHAQLLQDAVAQSEEATRVAQALNLGLRRANDARIPGITIYPPTD